MYYFHLQGSRSPRWLYGLTFEDEAYKLSLTSVTANLRWVTSQKSEDFVYTAEEACNYAQMWYVKIFIVSVRNLNVVSSRVKYEYLIKVI